MLKENIPDYILNCIEYKNKMLWISEKKPNELVDRYGNFMVYRNCEDVKEFNIEEYYNY